jgi:resuscitation-promoting factor RpfB
VQYSAFSPAKSGRITPVKKIGWLVLIFLTFFSACQTTKASVTIVDGDHVVTLSTGQRLPSELLTEAGITLGPDDRLLCLGTALPLDQPLPTANSCTLVVRRAVALTLVTPVGRQILQTSAQTVGQALVEAGFKLYAADRLDPPVEAPISGPLTVTYQPASELVVTVDGAEARIRSAAATVGQALAGAGLPLVGLDYAIPSENEPLPADGRIRVVRVTESIALIQQSIPYQTHDEYSADLELDQTALLQGGEPGLSVTRIRTRSEDGQQVSQQTESQSIVRPPSDRIVGYGTRVVMHTAVVDGQTITYWRALQFYATSYHPAETGSDITASGKRITGTGLVAIDNNYIPFGTQMYVPGYGDAEAADTGAFSGRWIDLAYPDAQYIPWHRWVTVYFLWPPPEVIAYTIPAPVTWSGIVPPSP